MSYNSRKGYEGEIECSQYLQKLYPLDIVRRFGGVEMNKFTNAGDVGVLPKAKQGFALVYPKRPVDDSPLKDIFIEVKNQANPNVWKSVLKAEDDASNAGKIGVLLYAIKQEKGSKGKRLICMRPEIFERLLKSYTQNE